MLRLSKRSLAAYKAWDTIRANRKAQVRHEATIKAWVTRRANAA